MTRSIMARGFEVGGAGSLRGFKGCDFLKIFLCVCIRPDTLFFGARGSRGFERCEEEKNCVFVFVLTLFLWCKGFEGVF